MASTRGYPIIGPFMAKMMRVKQMWQVGCTIEPQIWALGWFSALPQALWSLYGPDCRDQIYERFKRRHKARRTGIMNIAAQDSPAIAPSKGFGWVLFQGAEFAQRVGWYMLLADVIPNQLIISTSLAYKYQGCIDPNAPYAMLSMQNAIPFLPGETSGLIQNWIVNGTHTFTAGPTIVSTPAGYDPAVGFTLNAAPWRPEFPIPAWSARLVDLLTGFESPPFTPKNGPEGTQYVMEFAPEWGFFGAGHNFAIHIDKAPGVLFFTTGSFTVYGGPKIGLGPSYCANKPLKPINP